MLVKLGLALCLSINSTVGFVAAFWMDSSRPYSVLVAQLLTVFSWASHAIAMLAFSKSVCYTGRGPLLLNSSWYLTLIASILQFRSIIRWTLTPSSYHYVQPSDMYFSPLSRVVVYIHMGLQVLYAFSLFFAVSTSPDKVKGTSLAIQNGDASEVEDEEEEEPLISTRIPRSSYGSVPTTQVDFDLSRNANEGVANLLSLLLFWWVWPLLRRGACGHLQNTTDLPSLPKSLNTSLIREKFWNILQRRRASTSNRSTLVTANRDKYNNMKVGGSASEPSRSKEDVFETEVMMKSVARTTPPPPTPPMPRARRSKRNDSSVERSTCQGSERVGAGSNRASLLFLFSAVNRAFGWHYYPLGLLKFTTDLLGFAGPLLLYQLVSFIENKTVSFKRVS